MNIELTKEQQELVNREVETQINYRFNEFRTAIQNIIQNKYGLATQMIFSSDPNGSKLFREFEEMVEIKKLIADESRTFLMEHQRNAIGEIVEQLDKEFNQTLLKVPKEYKYERQLTLAKDKSVENIMERLDNLLKLKGRLHPKEILQIEKIIADNIKEAQI